MKHLILLLVLLFSVPGVSQVKMSPGSVASTVPWGQITGGITVQSDLVSYVYKRARVICVSDYANIHSAIDVLSSGDVLMIDNYAVCSKQDTIPRYVYLAVRGGKYIDPNSNILVIQADMTLVGSHKIFRVYSDSSLIRIQNNSLNPIWFGADRYNDNADSTTQAFKNCFGGLGVDNPDSVEAMTYGRVTIPSGVYLLNDEIWIRRLVIIEGENSGATSEFRYRQYASINKFIANGRSCIGQTAGGKFCFVFPGHNVGSSYGITLRNLLFFDATSDTTAAGGIKIMAKWQSVIEHCGFSEFEAGYGILSTPSPSGTYYSIWGVIHENVFWNCLYGITDWDAFYAWEIRNNRFLTGGGTPDNKIETNQDSSWFIKIRGYAELESNVYDMNGQTTTGYKWGIIIDGRDGNAVHMINEEFDTNTANGVKLIGPTTTDYLKVTVYNVLFNGADTALHIIGRHIAQFSECTWQGVVVDENLYEHGTRITSTLASAPDYVYKVWDYVPQINTIRTHGGYTNEFWNHFYNPVMFDSTLYIYGGKLNLNHPDFAVCGYGSGSTNFARKGFGVSFSDNNGGAYYDTCFVYSMNGLYDASGNNIGRYDLHSRFMNHLWISGETDDADSITWTVPDFYGTGSQESAMFYSKYGALSLFNPADDIELYGGKDNYIIAKETPDPPTGAKSGYGALYVNDSYEWVALDGSGNATPFSPHTPGEALPKTEVGIDPNEWFFNSVNKDSIQISVNMFKVIEALEQVTGQQFIWKRDLRTGESLRTFVKE